MNELSEDEGYYGIVDVNRLKLDIKTKLLAAKASAFVVTVVSRQFHAHEAKRRKHLEHVYWQSGTIIECNADVANCIFRSIIIVAAIIFVRDDGVQPDRIEVDVYLSDGKLCLGEVVACDHHYNLAAIEIKTDFPLQTAPLRELDDVVSIFDCNEPPQRSFQLVAHSNLFKVSPGTKLINLARDFQGGDKLQVYPGVFRADNYPFELDCNELYWLEDCNKDEDDGGPVINNSGEVIGIMFYESPFLPINIVSRWWKNFKNCGNYRRPWSGVEAVNLYSSRLDLLETFMLKFPNISAGVVVTKVAKESPAECSGLRAKDVIVKVDGKSVRSKLEFFEALWEKVGISVELNVLRTSNGDELKLSLTIGEATPEKFYNWRLNSWRILQHGNNVPSVSQEL